MSKLRHLTTFVTTVAVVGTLSACTTAGWVPEAPPAAGVQTDAGGLKLRNFLVIADGEGAAMITGGIASRDAATEVVGLGVAPETTDNTFGDQQAIRINEEIGQGQTITLDGTETRFEDDALQLGRLALVSVAFSDGQIVSLEVPVLSSDHPDFAEAWAAAHA